MTAALVPLHGLPGTVTAVSLILPPGLTLEQWVDAARLLGLLGRGMLFWAGDLLCHGEDYLGQEYAQFVDQLGYAPQTLLNCVWVARQVPPERRRAALSWSHHAAVSGLQGAAQGDMLDWAERCAQQGSPVTVKALREKVREIKGEPESVAPLPLTDLGDRLAAAALVMIEARRWAPGPEWTRVAALRDLALDWQKRRQS